MSDLLSRDQILGQTELPSAFVMVPGWGGRVKVRTMTAEERDRFDRETAKIVEDGGETFDNLRARLVAACVVDDAGALLFKPDDVAALGKKSTRDVTKVYRVAAELNGFGDDEDDAGN